MKTTRIVFSFVLLTLLIGVIVGCAAPSVSADDSYVTIDINPSIELIVSPRERVIAANPLNEDGEALLLEVSLVGKLLEDAMDLIIEKAIELGYIDVDSEEVFVSVATVNRDDNLGLKMQNRVKEAVNEAFKNRGMMGKGVDKAFTPDFVKEASDLGVTPGFLRLIQSVMAEDDELLLEDALLMTPQELMGTIYQAKRQMKDVAQGIRDDFFAARDLIREEYLPQIQALEGEMEALIEEIEELEGNLETLTSTEGYDEAEAEALETLISEKQEALEALEAELEVIKTEFHEKLAEVRDAFHEASKEARDQLRAQNQARREAIRNQVEAFKNQMRERSNQMKDQIESFQQNNQKRP